MSEEPNLFLIYVGGRAPKANIELHDVLFAAGTTIEDTYAALHSQWFGDPKSLHLDSYFRVRNIDGYKVRLRSDRPKHKEKLFFVNLGGYDPDNLAELHEFGLFVATTGSKAKVRAKARLLVDAQSRHKDDQFEVDDCLGIVEVGNYFVHLEHGGAAQAQRPDWFGYKPIGK